MRAVRRGAARARVLARAVIPAPAGRPAWPSRRRRGARRAAGSATLARAQRLRRFAGDGALPAYGMSLQIAPVPADGARVRLVEAPHGRRHARGHDDGAARSSAGARSRRARCCYAAGDPAGAAKARSRPVAAAARFEDGRRRPRRAPARCSSSSGCVDLGSTRPSRAHRGWRDATFRGRATSQSAHRGTSSTQAPGSAAPTRLRERGAREPLMPESGAGSRLPAPARSSPARGRDSARRTQARDRAIRRPGRRTTGFATLGGIRSGLGKPRRRTMSAGVAGGRRRRPGTTLRRGPPMVGRDGCARPTLAASDPTRSE